MFQIVHVIRHAPQSQWLFQWQSAVITAFAGGSLMAGLFNLCAMMALAVARSALSSATNMRRWAPHHA